MAMTVRWGYPGAGMGRRRRSPSAGSARQAHRFGDAAGLGAHRVRQALLGPPRGARRSAGHDLGPLGGAASSWTTRSGARMSGYDDCPRPFGSSSPSKRLPECTGASTIGKMSATPRQRTPAWECMSSISLLRR